MISTTIDQRTSQTSSAPDPVPPVENEDRFLERLRAGEEEAHEELVHRFSGRLYSAVRPLLPRAEDAQDAVQEAFLSAFRSLHAFRGGCRLSTWLHRIAVNAALMKLRSGRRRPEIPIEMLLPQFDESGHHASPIAPWYATPADEVLREETRRQVRAAIERLPLSYRTVLVLRDIEELSTEETAQILSLTTTAVKVRLHRARMALRTLLAPVFEKQPEEAPSRPPDRQARNRTSATASK